MLFSLSDSNDFSSGVLGKRWLEWLLALVFFLLLIGNTPFKKVFYGVFVFVYFLLFAFYGRNKLAFFAKNSVVMVLFVAYFSISFAWSVIPSVTFSAVLSQLVFVLFSVFVCSCLTDDGFVNSLNKAVVSILVVIILYCLTFPGESYYVYGLKSFYGQKNLLGAVAAICFIFIFNKPAINKFDICLILSAVALLFASKSKTSIIIVFFCLATLPAVRAITERMYQQSDRLLVTDVLRKIVYLVVLLALVILVLYRDEVLDFLWANISKSVFTGRGMLWLTVIQQIRAHSLLGLGPGVFWQAGGASEIAQTSLYQKDPYWVQNMLSSDGGYVDLVASIGFVGLSLFLLTAVHLYGNIFRNWHRKDSALIFSLVTFVLLHAVTESTIFYSTNILWFFYLICYFRVAGWRDDSIDSKPRLMGV
jgi:O-antigen ligase